MEKISLKYVFQIAPWPSHEATTNYGEFLSVSAPPSLINCGPFSC